jgi:putative peptidoglycan lipid II flippase
MFPLKHVGLALATSLSSWLNVWLLSRALSTNLGQWADLKRTTMISTALSIFIGLGAWLVPVNKYAALALIVVWAVVYMGLAAALRVEEATLLLEFINKKLLKRAKTA